MASKGLYDSVSHDEIEFDYHCVVFVCIIFIMVICYCDYHRDLLLSFITVICYFDVYRHYNLYMCD